MPPSRPDQDRFDRHLDPVRRTLGPAVFEQAFGEGRNSTAEAASGMSNP